MRKILLLMMIVWPFLSHGQSHVTFKDIPIEGNLTEFIAKMEKAGFSFVNKQEYKANMKGDFVGKNCDVSIFFSKKTNTVWKVAVYLPEYKTWDSLKADFLSYQKQYTSKYGKPEHVYEIFARGSDGDGNELQALKDNKVSYMTFWKIENGGLIASIGKSANIIFEYEDNAGAIVAQTERGDIHEDI